MRYHLIITGSLLLLAACAGKVKLPDESNPGAMLYLEKCSGCHEPIPPRENYYYQWERLFALIEQGWNHKEIKEPISQEDKTLILKYLEAHAKPEYTEEELLDMKQKQTGVYEKTKPSTDNRGLYLNAE